MDKKIVIVGGGFAGLFAALVLAKSGRGKDIIVVEKANEFGGLVSSFDYGGDVGLFDKGIHHLSDTGHEDIDRLLQDVLRGIELRPLSGAERNLTGNYCNGTFELETQFCSLNTLDKDLYSRYLTDFFENLNQRGFELSEKDSVEATLKTSFGEKITSEIIRPILERKFLTKLDDLHPLSIQLCPFNRIALFDEALNLDLIDTALGQRLGFKDQRNLPAEKLSKLSSYYPKKYGLKLVIQEIVKQLEGMNVQMLPETTLSDIHINQGAIDSVRLNGTDEVSVEHLIWSSGLPGIAHLVGADLSDLAYDPPLRTVLVNLKLKQMQKFGHIHAVLCYDDLGLNIYRLTKYSNYCDDANADGTEKMTAELLFGHDQPIDKDEIRDKTINALQKMGVIESSDDVLFSAVELLPEGFPKPTQKNMQSISILRDRIQNLAIKNLSLTGKMAEKELFFMTDVLQHSYHVCEGLKKGPGT